VVQARLSQCYDKVNIAFDYCTVELYPRAFSAKAQGAVVPLTSTSERLSPQK